MSELGIEHFDQFFRELHEDKQPFPWQRNLAERVMKSGWPEVIDLPTASGKTACVDIALFALACTGIAPRRIFFVVDRRVVVNEASNRTREIAKRLKDAKEGMIGEVARRFREMCGDEDAEPLATYELRGGIYRDESWVRNARQPAVIASTVDQVGSRLLFRGYGVSDGVLPIHASLIANDALILLDEAHCSKAFAQTLSRIKEYRGEKWAEEPLRSPFASVEMTATPSVLPRHEPFRLGAEDREPANLGKRLRARKVATLASAKGKEGDWEKLAKKLVQEALEIAEKAEGVRRIAVMVNRVATARLVWQGLRDEGKNADLVIGRMRPIDRDELNLQLAPLKAGEKRSEVDEPWFVVTTQCLEAGADLDFDALITECASIDALLQRFGRLDRLGSFVGRAVGRIVALAGQVDGKKPDAVYGEALANTWEWLSELAKAGELNFGIEAMEGEPATIAQLWRDLPDAERATKMIDSPDAPVLLPAHLDALVQTSPKPSAEPSVDLFLHGPQRGNRDIQVVWRADLDSDRPEGWAEIVAICPPVSAEAMPVPIWEFQRWISESEAPSEEGDIEGALPVDEDNEIGGPRKAALIWRGDDSTTDLTKLRLGDTVVIPARYGGGKVLGHTLVADGAGLDAADRAFLQARQKMRLRLHPRLVSLWPERPSRAGVMLVISQEDFEWRDLQGALKAYREESGTALPVWLDEATFQVISKPQRDFQLAFYSSEGKALAIEGRFRLPRTDAIDGDAQGDEMSVGSYIALDRHLEDVRREVASVRHLVSQPLGDALEIAAQWHDCGKADLRFQTLLHNGDHLAARYAPQLLAKGKFVPGRRGNGLDNTQLPPKGFRHELISLALVSGGHIVSDEHDLFLHLIASHHGRCRPFAPVIQDDNAEDLLFRSLTLTAADRLHRAAHRLDSGVADRFWSLSRRFGWWGLAYIESLLRLSDWSASAKEVPVKAATK